VHGGCKQLRLDEAGVEPVGAVVRCGNGACKGKREPEP
jgi:hypothetical protein